MSGRDDPDFLGRWSRRKRDAAKGETEDDAIAPASEESESTPAAAPEEEKSDAEILEELGLPDPDTLGPGADFKAFMKEAVPQRLRNRALRRLWLSDPALANLDELLEYGEDFTAPSVVEAIETVYQVGKGYLLGDEDGAKDGDEVTAAAKPARPAAPEDETPTEPDSAAVDPATTGEEAPAAVAAAPDPATPDPAAPGGEAAVPGQADGGHAVMPRRRMRFHVAES